MALLIVVHVVSLDRNVRDKQPPPKIDSPVRIAIATGVFVACHGRRRRRATSVRRADVIARSHTSRNRQNKQQKCEFDWQENCGRNFLRLSPCTSEHLRAAARPGNRLALWPDLAAAAHVKFPRMCGIRPPTWLILFQFSRRRRRGALL